VRVSVATGPARVAAVVLVLALGAGGCGASGTPDVTVGRAQAAQPIAGASQIVVEITNRGDGDDTLVAADTDAALGVEIHLTSIEDGRASMSQLDRVGIPAGGTVRFRPGELHLMMVVPDETVTLGGTFELTLRFDRSGEVTVPVEVVELLDLTEEDDDPYLRGPYVPDPDPDAPDA
jgi:periplasmic copper chaperone A